MKNALRLLASFAVVFVTPTSRADIKARGSDSTLHVIKALAAAFEADTGTKVALEGGGSGAGAKSVIAGDVALAFLSRQLNDTEKAAGLTGTAYAKDGVVIIVNQANTVAGFTTAELKDIFTGKTTTWADGKPIVAFNRNADSGTREVFQEHVLGKDPFAPTVAVKHDGVLISSVQKIVSSIAYTSLGEVDPAKVRIIPVAGVTPSPATLNNGTYSLTRTPTFATKGAPSGEAKAFIDFVLSAKGHAIIAKEGLIPLK